MNPVRSSLKSNGKKTTVLLKPAFAGYDYKMLSSILSRTSNGVKTMLTVFLIVGFLGIAVFGVFAMDFAMDGGEHGHDGCIAATAQGGNCPGWQSGIALLIFHLDAFRGFSTAVFSDSFANAFLWLLGLMPLAVFGFFATARQMAPKLTTNYRHSGFVELSSFRTRQEFIHWLALHENSPQSFIWRRI